MLLTQTQQEMFEQMFKLTEDSDTQISSSNKAETIRTISESGLKRNFIQVAFLMLGAKTPERRREMALEYAESYVATVQALLLSVRLLYKMYFSTLTQSKAVGRAQVNNELGKQNAFRKVINALNTLPIPEPEIIFDQTKKLSRDEIAYILYIHSDKKISKINQPMEQCGDPLTVLQNIAVYSAMTYFPVHRITQRILMDNSGLIKNKEFWKFASDTYSSSLLVQYDEQHITELMDLMRKERILKALVSNKKISISRAKVVKQVARNLNNHDLSSVMEKQDKRMEKYYIEWQRREPLRPAERPIWLQDKAVLSVVLVVCIAFLLTADPGLLSFAVIVLANLGSFLILKSNNMSKENQTDKAYQEYKDVLENEQQSIVRRFQLGTNFEKVDVKVPVEALPFVTSQSADTTTSSPVVSDVKEDKEQVLSFFVLQNGNLSELNESDKSIAGVAPANNGASINKSGAVNEPVSVLPKRRKDTFRPKDRHNHDKADSKSERNSATTVTTEPDQISLGESEDQIFYRLEGFNKKSKIDEELKSGGKLKRFVCIDRKVRLYGIFDESRLHNTDLLNDYDRKALGNVLKEDCGVNPSNGMGSGVQRVARHQYKYVPAQKSIALFSTPYTYKLKADNTVARVFGKKAGLISASCNGEKLSQEEIDRMNVVLFDEVRKKNSGHGR